MKHILKTVYVKAACFMFMLLSLSNPVLSAAQYDYIDITNPFFRKIPIAVPQFKALTLDEQAREVTRSTVDNISEALEFAGYFKILDRSKFLYDPEKSGISTSDINFKNWRAVGADFLVTGGVQVKENILEMELRLFDTVKEQTLIGKRYKGMLKDQRRMILRFCSELIFQLTGNRGVYDSRIALISTTTGHKEIFMADFDGKNPTQFTRHNSITLSPAWSSDLKWIAYTSYAQGKPDLYIKNIKEQRGVRVAQKGLNITPAWMPGQFSLAATLSFSGDQEIYLLTGTGKIIKRLTYNTDIDISPSWSPDGKKMAFVSKREGTPQIHILDMGSNSVERLTFHGKYNTQPAWSPKGNVIAYSGMENGVSNIYLMGVDGKGPVQLTDGTGYNESPTWSPDGSLIAFSSTREGPSRIYVMTAFGTDQRRLLTLPGEQTNPSWSPHGYND